MHNRWKQKSVLVFRAKLVDALEDTPCLQTIPACSGILRVGFKSAEERQEGHSDENMGSCCCLEDAKYHMQQIVCGALCGCGSGWVTDSVLDTYKSFSTTNKPKENISMYAKTYRTLSFKKSYARTGQEILYTGMDLSPKGNGVAGFVTKYKCTYRTW